MKKIITTGLFCVFFLAQTIFGNDQVILKNGDKISGKIIKKETDKIVIETELAGIITIPTLNIEKVTENAEDREKVDIIKAKYEKNETEIVTVENIEEPETKTEKTVENYENKLETEVKMPIMNQKKRALSLTVGWEGTANLGFSLTGGNSKTSTFTAGVRAEKSGESNKWTTYLNSLWNRNRIGNSNVTTSNAIWGGIRYDKNINKKTFVFGLYDFERDRPQRVNFRSVLGAGLGYHAVKNDKTELDLFGGAAWNKTWFIGPNRSSAEVLVGNTLKHKFNDRVKIQQGFTLYPSLSNGGEYRFIFDSTLTADVTKRMGWFVTLADRYNSLPLAGVQKNDYLFATGLKWSFGKIK
jgi:putative salt-induced outer membrane protein YdiY